ncbi:peptidylglycine monooxygenase [Paenalcaligenes niemegkensis]|uniref:peptidylglycine monooxygenase n=1 Tax=Paenalcaligenes niemegkensis TaxID=2895469 RepID=UPI001EE798B4|nr:peptidylglycine monooxygenase [Paenalcaligenes niemegkensis]MCQ9618069.1 peptidylglycine monooxygenase [Paenalcaligenes niemegkensis]
MTSNSEITVLLGTQRYRLLKHWLGAEHTRGISSVAVLSDGSVAVLSRTQPALKLFDSMARPLAEWSIPGLRCAHQLSALPGGGVLVCDVDGHQLIAVDSSGEVLWQLGRPDQPGWQQPFNHPTHGLVLANGNLLVSDGYGNSCVHYFDAQRRLIRSVGTAGDQPHSRTEVLQRGVPVQFSVPHHITADGKQVFVADRENSRVVVLDHEGTLLRVIRPMYKPMALAITPEGNLLVSDQTASLSLFTPDGELLGRCRVTAVYGHGLSCDAEGRIFIAEMVPDGLTCLEPILDEP